jgi:hypothetical protein
MSTNAMEKALWQALSDRKEMQRFREDAPAYLDGFRLDETERALILSWDVAKVVSRGVNPLLVVSAFSAVNGLEKTGEYIMKINGLGQAAPPA